jgi:hypothetical protein
MRELATEQERRGSVREIRVLEALAFDGMAEQSQARAALREALGVAEPDRHVGREQ